MRYIGIDPGKTGGIVALSDKGNILLAHSMMTTDEFAIYLTGLLELSEQLFIFCEKAQAMPKNGAVGMFNYGMHFGELLGVIIALKIPFELIPPRTWTKVMHQGVVGDKPKLKSAIAVKRLFPNSGLDHFSKKQLEGIVDALLIAEYGRRRMVHS